MVIDDEPLIGSTLTRMLGDEHDVVSTTDARKALRLLETERFDVIVTDLMMPRMSGVEFFEAVLASAPAIAETIVFLTGGATTPSAQEFLACVPNAVLEKPADVQALRALIRARVARQRETADA